MDNTGIIFNPVYTAGMDQEKFTVITSDYFVPDLSWEQQQYTQAGMEFYAYQLRRARLEEQKDKLSRADVLVVDQTKVTAQLIQALKRCRLIIRYGEGYDNVNLAAAAQAGIVCANKPGFYSRNTAEQAFATALSLALRIPMQQEIAADAADCTRVMPYNSLQNLTVGIIGFGKIGQISARLFKPIVKQILISNYCKDLQAIQEAGVIAMDLDNLLPQTDILLLSVPATPETAGMVNKQFLEKLKKGAILVNYARGAIVNTEALLAALQSGRLAGAGLDCTQPEPLPSRHPLFTMHNVIVTPHLGWYSEDALWAIRRSILQDALNAHKGLAPESVLNPEVFQNPHCRLGGRKSLK